MTKAFFYVFVRDTVLNCNPIARRVITINTWPIKSVVLFFVCVCAYGRWIIKARERVCAGCGCCSVITAAAPVNRRPQESAINNESLARQRQDHRSITLVSSHHPCVSACVRFFQQETGLPASHFAVSRNQGGEEVRSQLPETQTQRKACLLTPEVDSVTSRPAERLSAQHTSNSHSDSGATLSPTRWLHNAPDRGGRVSTRLIFSPC